MTADPAAPDSTPISTKAVEAVARRLYGDEAYEALTDGQVKEAYRIRARGLLQAAQDATNGR